MPAPSGVIWIRAEVEPRIGSNGTCKPRLELIFADGSQGPPCARVAKSLLPSTWLRRPYQMTRMRSPLSVPPESAANMRTKSWFGPRHTTGLVAELPLGSESEFVPVGRNGSFPLTTAAPPESDQPVLPDSKLPFGARK